MPLKIFLTLFFISLPAAANTLLSGQPLPPLAIAERGELLLEADEFSFSPWQTPQATGKVQVLQYLAARTSARDQSKPFTDRLEDEVPYGNYHMTTIINLDDAIWGTSGFVLGELKSSKRKYPLSTIVLDEEGLGLRTWQLQDGGANILIIDPQGRLSYVKHGVMSEQEIETALELIKAQIAELGD